MSSASKYMFYTCPQYLQPALFNGSGFVQSLANTFKTIHRTLQLNYMNFRSRGFWKMELQD